MIADTQVRAPIRMRAPPAIWVRSHERRAGKDRDDEARDDRHDAKDDEVSPLTPDRCPVNPQGQIRNAIGYPSGGQQDGQDHQTTPAVG